VPSSPDPTQGSPTTVTYQDRISQETFFSDAQSPTVSLQSRGSSLENIPNTALLHYCSRIHDSTSQVSTPVRHVRNDGENGWEGEIQVDPELLNPDVQVPRVVRLLPESFTTLVVRNIPARYSQEMLLTEFQPDGTFDLFFLPYSFRDGRTMGYAFVNFRSHDAALDFQQQWHRQFLQDHGRTKHLDVAAATVQGLRENLAQFNERSVARLQRIGMLPVLFDQSARRLDAIHELIRHGIMPQPRIGQRQRN